jgi:hypothetical protein
MTRSAFPATLAFLCLSLHLTAEARPRGIAGYSGMNGKDCTACHPAGASTPTVTLTGPTTLAPGAQGSYSVVIKGGPGDSAGLDVAANGGATLAVIDSAATKLAVNGELVQPSPKPFSGGQVTFPLTVTAPASPGSFTLYVAGMSANGDSDVSGDGTTTTTLKVTVTGNSPAPQGTNPTTPTFAEPAAAVPSQVTGTTSSLSSLAVETGSDPIIYTWTSLSGPAAVSFNPNGTTDANDSTANFTVAGTYALQITATDGVSGQTATSTCNVTVVSTSAQIVLTPSLATIQVSGNQQFSAALTDQFGAAIASAAGTTWSVSGGGSVDAWGNFTADSTPGGPYTLQASSNTFLATADLRISNQAPPTITVPAQAAAPVVNGTSTLVLVQGDSASGSESLTYTWSVLSGPGNVTFSPNATNDAASSTATFGAAGDYLLQAALVDPAGNTTVSVVDVTVAAVPAGLAISPGNVTVAPGSSEIFTATQLDQFGNALPQLPSVQWSISGGGSVANTGRFLAGSIEGGPYTLTATGGGTTGTATITVGTSGSTTPGSRAQGTSCSAIPLNMGTLGGLVLLFYALRRRRGDA